MTTLDPNPIIAGTMNWGTWGANMSSEQAASLIEDCLAMNVRQFDHADIYGGHTTETLFGNAWSMLKIDRKEIEIITKCGIMYPSPQRPQIKVKHYDYSKKHIIASVRNSIAQLQCDYIDTLLLHRPSPLMNPVEIAETFDELESAKMVRKFGVSNFTIPQMDSLRKYVPISTMQIEFSPLHLHPYTNGLLDYALQHHIEVQAWSPLGGGKLFDPNEPLHHRLQAIADNYDWPLDVMCYAFLMHHPVNIQPVVGTTKASRIKGALSATDIQLSTEQWFEIYTAALGHKVP